MDREINQSLPDIIAMIFFMALTLSAFVSWKDKSYKLKDFWRYGSLALICIIGAKKTSLFISGVSVFDVWLIFNTIVILFVLGVLNGMQFYVHEKYANGTMRLNDIFTKIPCSDRPIRVELGSRDREAQLLSSIIGLMVFLACTALSFVEPDNSLYDKKIIFKYQEQLVKETIQLRKKDSIIDNKISQIKKDKEIQRHLLKSYYNIKED